MSEELPSTEQSVEGARDWPHAPPHRLESAGVYFLTARSRKGAHLLQSEDLRDWFQDRLFELADEFGWQLEAWAILSNHYHLVGHSPDKGAQTLGPMIQKLHSLTTKELNRREGKPGRTRLWHNFRETHLTYQRSYLARLHYVHQNAVHHGLVAVGSQWKWCSAKAFVAEATPAWVKTIASFRYEEIARADGE